MQEVPPQTEENSAASDVAWYFNPFEPRLLLPADSRRLPSPCLSQMIAAAMFDDIEIPPQPTASNVVDIRSARRRLPSKVADFTDQELEQLRRLAAMAERILKAVELGELVSHGCPTARRVLADHNEGRDG